MAHNMWLGYDLAAWNVILSISPEKGNDIMMQTLPGSIQGCGVDVYVNSAGLMVTNTTLSGLKTFNPKGTPYFVRARKAIQYAKSIDDWLDIVTKRNNGGDASGWLVGDSKTNEACYLELGTFNQAVQRTKNGFFVGCTRHMILRSKVRPTWTTATPQAPHNTLHPLETINEDRKRNDRYRSCKEVSS